MKIAIIIPAYNEASAIAVVVSDIHKEFSASKYKFQIVVIDDGSKDKTSYNAKSAGAHVIKHVINCGSGGATATGLSYADQNDFDIAITMDADGQHAASDALKGVQELSERNLDLLIGSRLIDSRGMSKVKILGNKGLTFITYILFGINVTDSQSGMRAFSRRALNDLRWKTSGYEFCSEMLWRAKQLNLDIGEYPIRAIYTDYSMSKGQNNWNAINIVKSLLKRRLLELFW